MRPEFQTHWNSASAAPTDLFFGGGSVAAEFPDRVGPRSLGQTALKPAGIGHSQHLAKILLVTLGDLGSGQSRSISVATELTDALPRICSGRQTAGHNHRGDDRKYAELKGVHDPESTATS
jgi:hypothetical protein